VEGNVWQFSLLEEHGEGYLTEVGGINEPPALTRKDESIVLGKGADLQNYTSATRFSV
jgi:hypothetical protein